ncbi:MAG: hypothetical protein ACK56I_05750, partial [bacterium]
LNEAQEKFKRASAVEHSLCPVKVENQNDGDIDYYYSSWDDSRKKTIQKLVETGMALLKKAQEKFEDATQLESSVRCLPCTSDEALDGMKPSAGGVAVVVEPQVV